jgi:hypothetical protein
MILKATSGRGTPFRRGCPKEEIALQLVHEAVEAIKDGLVYLVDRDRPLLYLATSQSLIDRPNQVELLVEILRRRVAALRYFCAHSNFLVDRNICQDFAATMWTPLASCLLRSDPHCKYHMYLCCQVGKGK